MSKLQDIRELAQEHATLVSSSPRDWMGYMDTAARLYRYPFTDQLLIHAQHPQATACASLELWNEKMFRWVNRGEAHVTKAVKEAFGVEDVVSSHEKGTTVIHAPEKLDEDKIREVIKEAGYEVTGITQK